MRAGRSTRQGRTLRVKQISLGVLGRPAQRGLDIKQVVRITDLRNESVADADNGITFNAADKRVSVRLYAADQPPP